MSQLADHLQIVNTDAVEVQTQRNLQISTELETIKDSKNPANLNGFRQRSENQVS